MCRRFSGLRALRRFLIHVTHLQVVRLVYLWHRRASRELGLQQRSLAVTWSTAVAREQLGELALSLRAVGDAKNAEQFEQVVQIV